MGPIYSLYVLGGLVIYVCVSRVVELCMEVCGQHVQEHGQGRNVHANTRKSELSTLVHLGPVGETLNALNLIWRGGGSSLYGSYRS